MKISTALVDSILVFEHDFQYQKLLSYAQDLIVEAKKIVMILSDIEMLDDSIEIKAKNELLEAANIVDSLVHKKVESRVLDRYVRRLDDKIKSVFV